MNEMNNEKKCERCGSMGEHQHGMMCGKGMWCGKWGMRRSRGMSGIYCFAFLGAAAFYLQQATTFWSGLVGIGKAIVWPAMLIYKAFTLLGM